MSFCSKCGQKIQENSAFCQSCGEPTAKDSQFNTPFNSTTINTGFNDEQRDIQNNKALAILAYLGILVLVPIFAGNNSKFARFHANQGLVNTILCIVYYVVIGIFNIFLMIISPELALLMMLLLNFAGIAFLVFVIIGIINAANGQMKELPLIGKIKILN